MEFYLSYVHGKMTYTYTWRFHYAFKVHYMTCGLKPAGNKMIIQSATVISVSSSFKIFFNNSIFSITRAHQDVGFTSLTILLLVHQIGSALDHIHNVGVIHRDVKMENILLGAGNRLKQLDIRIRREKNIQCLDLSLMDDWQCKPILTSRINIDCLYRRES